MNYLFQLHPDAPLAAAKRELHRLPLQNLYVIQEESTTLIGGTSPTHPLPPLRHSRLVDTPTVDWDAQWASFAPHFHKGRAHIPLTPTLALPLVAGPGFGDASHPTTRLMLDLHVSYAPGQTVLDVGCGSGILTLAALLLGASSAHGVDIDPAALAHARQNAALNNLPATFTLALPPLTNTLLLLNMIYPEQQALLAAAPHLPTRAKTWILSGLLNTERPKVLATLQKHHFNLVEESQSGPWLAFVATPKNHE